MCYNYIILFLLVDMAEATLTNEMKRHAVIVSLAAGHTDSEIATFLKVARSFVFKVRTELGAAKGDGAEASQRKQVCRRSDSIRNAEFVSRVQSVIDENPGKSMRSLGRELQVDEATIRRVVHEDLRYTSYAMRRGQFMSEITKVNRLTRAKRLLNKLKHPEEPGMIWFFSDEKNFVQDQKVNRKNDRWLCKTPDDVPTIMHTKFPASVMVLGVVSSEGDVMPPHFFSAGARVNAVGYTEVLRTVVKPWIATVAGTRPYVFQQDSAPCHTARTTQEWMADNFHDHVIPNVWPPSSPDVNPLDFYVWGVVERDSNSHSHNTITALKSAIVDAMANIPKTHLITACSRFRRRVEAVIAANGGFIE